MISLFVVFMCILLEDDGTSWLCEFISVVLSDLEYLCPLFLEIVLCSSLLGSLITFMLFCLMVPYFTEVLSLSLKVFLLSNNTFGWFLLLCHQVHWSFILELLSPTRELSYQIFIFQHYSFHLIVSCAFHFFPHEHCKNRSGRQKREPNAASV